MTILPSPLKIEKSLWKANKRIIAGIDEAGRGALAGPIVAAMVILPVFQDSDQFLYAVKDSKMMTPSRRAEWAEKIKEHALFWSVGIIHSQEIDAFGIQAANQMAMSQAIQKYPAKIDYHLFDFIHWKDCPFVGERFKRGESSSLSIAAASVLAKTTRDLIMIELSKEHPIYRWYKNKGYGTREHIAAIHNYGYSPHHRMTFTLKERYQ